MRMSQTLDLFLILHKTALLVHRSYVQFVLSLEQTRACLKPRRLCSHFLALPPLQQIWLIREHKLHLFVLVWLLFCRFVFLHFW